MWVSDPKGRAKFRPKTLYTLALSDEDPVQMGWSCGILARARVAQKSSSVKRNDASSPKDLQRGVFVVIWIYKSILHLCYFVNLKMG